jgi:methylmalonyl-CoA mutase
MSLQKHLLYTKASEFKICQNIFVFDIENQSNEHWTHLEGRQSSFYIEDTIDIGKLLEKLPLENVAVYFNFKFFSIDFVKTIDLLFNIRKPLLIITWIQ